MSPCGLHLVSGSARLRMRGEKRHDNRGRGRKRCAGTRACKVYDAPTLTPSVEAAKRELRE
jgi:hypothetical protein